MLLFFKDLDSVYKYSRIEYIYQLFLLSNTHPTHTHYSVQWMLNELTRYSSLPSRKLRSKTDTSDSESTKKTQGQIVQLF